MAGTDDHWLKRHEGRERHLRDELRAYFREQADRLADALLQFDQPGPSVVPLIFRPDDEHERLLRAVERPLLLSMGIGALDVLNESGKDKGFDFGASLIDVPFDLPPSVLQAVRLSLIELGEQPYWLDIQTETETQLADLIRDGIEQGANAERIARRLREEIGGFEARKRARKIARTETTGALNAGHQAAGDSLQADGFLVRKTWSTAGDRDVRETHSDLDGTSVANSEDFIVGSTPAPYPGHWGLPAKDRIHCRCGVVTRVVGE